MNFTTALIGAVLGLLAAEDPTLPKSPDRWQSFQQSVTRLVPIHVATAAEGRLVNPEMDALILATINYAETRFRLPAPKGDCYRTHAYNGVPSGRWPKGYVPKMRWVCPAVGPLNIAQGNRFVVHEWPEIQELLPGVLDERLTVKDMEDITTNITLGYGIVDHWKNACPNKNAPASVASWLTAYRWGRCTPQHWNKRYFDDEARRRCERLERMAAHIRSAGVPLEPTACLPRQKHAT